MTIRLKGRRRLADVQVLADEPSVVGPYAVMARDNRNFARFNNIGFDVSGNPRPPIFTSPGGQERAPSG